MSATDILRDALFGNPPSPTAEPSREGVLAAFTDLEARATTAISSAVAGIVYYATGTDRAADTTKPIGTLGKAANEADYYRRSGTGWVVDNTVYAGVAAVVKPQIDKAQLDATNALTAIIPTLVATMGANAADGTYYNVTEPAGFTLTQQGAKFSFVAPATNLGPAVINLRRAGTLVQGSLIEMVIGQPIVKGSRIEVSNNLAQNKFTLDRQSLDAVALSDLVTDVGQLDADPANPHTANRWYFKTRTGTKLLSALSFRFFAPMNITGPLDLTIDGFTARLRKAAGNDLAIGDFLVNELISAAYPGADQNSFFVTARGLPQTATTPSTGSGISIPVDSPVFTQTDYPAASTIVKTPTSLKITRPIADALNHRLASPNARDRTRAAASWIEWDVMHGAPGNMPAPKVPLVLVDGAPAAATVSNAGAADAYTIRTVRVVPGAGIRTVEMVWPYEGPMEIIARRVSGDAVFATTPARPTELLVTCGDSETQGFAVDSEADQWPFLLAKDLGFRCINHGYGGRGIISADGTVYGAEGGDITTMFILANDVSQGTPLATVTSRLNAFWAAFFAAHPAGNNAKLLMISQPWMEAGDGGVATTIPGPQYRTTMQNAVAAAVGTYPNLKYKSGLDLTDGAGTTTDGTHFKSATSRTQFYPRLKTHLQSLGWTIAPFTFTTGAMPTGATIARAAGPASRVNAASVQEITTGANIARLDYAPVTGAARGLLLEPSRTNRLLQSGTPGGASWINAAWTATPASLPAASYPSLSKVVYGASASISRTFQSNPAASGTTQVASCYVKAGSLTNYAFITQEGGTASIAFDFRTGTITSAIGVNSSGVEALPDGVYRIWMAFTRPSSGTYLFFWLSTATTNANGTQGMNHANNGRATDGTEFAYISGCQLEDGAVLSTYIPTTTDAVTRPADILTLDWTSRNVPDGSIITRYTFDDNTTQDVSTVVSSGKSSRAALNRFCIRRAEIVS